MLGDNRFVAPYNLTVTGQKVIAVAEYFCDTDPGTGNGITLPAADGAFDEPEEDVDISTIDSSAFGPGLHYLYIRFQDNEGMWGPTRKVAFTGFGLAAAEYYIDVDPGVGHGTALPPVDGSFGAGEEEVSIAEASVRSLPPGSHNLFVRFRDAWGRWGASQGTEFLILPNHVPSFVKGADQTVLEDAGARTVSAWATDISAGVPGESWQELDFIVTNSNNGLFAVQPAVSPDGTLTYTPAANANGSATVTVRLHDNGGTVGGGVDTSPPQTFQVTVTPVNDAPGFTGGADQTVLEDAGAQTVSGWATGIGPGPADESGQALDFRVTNHNNALFAVQPAISPAGALIYTPAASANGSATVTVVLHDDGGTANGGVDTSASQTFTISVTPVNHAPIAADDGFTMARWQTLERAAPGLLGNDTDPDGNVLTAARVTAPTHGTLTLYADGRFSYAPETGFSGQDSFTYVANDGQADSNIATVTITVLNQSPTIDPIGPQSVTELQTVSFTVTGSDPDRDPITFRVVTALPEGANFNPATGEFTWHPCLEEAGSYEIAFQISDGAASAQATVGITVDPAAGVFFTDSYTHQGSADPDWQVRSGRWAPSKGTFGSMSTRASNLAVTRELCPVAAAIFQAKIKLGAGGQANGKLVFAGQGAKAFRYVALVPGAVQIGQNGRINGVNPGVKKNFAQKIAIGRWYQLTARVAADGTVEVRVGAKRVGSYRFPRGAVGGTFGLETTKARTTFDDYSASTNP